MKKSNFSILLMGYCIPYSFLALYCDCVWKISWGYIPLILIPVLLSWFNAKYNRFSYIVLCNILTSVFSSLLSYWFLSPYNTYFKPFSAIGMTLAVCLFSFMLQVLLWSWKKQLEPAQSLIVAVCGISVILILLFILFSWSSMLRMSV